MARQFEILDNNNVDWLFLDRNSHTPSEYISYRHFICHGLHSLLHCQGINECKNEFEKLKNAFEKNLSYANENFVRLYQINALNGDTGCVLIDETQWCYPLIFDNQQRINALKNSINDIDKNLDNIISHLSKNENWDKSMQDNLEKIYHFS